MIMLSCPPLRHAAPRRVLLPGICAALLLAASCGDGGTGPTPKPDPQNPVPSISSVDPAAVPQYSDSVTMTITGSGFVNGAVVRLNGTARLTTYVSASQLQAVLPLAATQEAMPVQVTVFNAAPGGGESAAVPLPVEHRVPTMATLSPGGAMQGDSAFVLEVTGIGFARASVIRWNGADRPTTFVDPYHLTARIAAADLDSVGTAEVTVFNPAPGGGTSEPRDFATVVRPNPVPYLSTLSPDTVLVDVGGAITVMGSGFMAGTTVQVGGFSPTPTVVSPTELRFTLEPQQVPERGYAQVQLTNPEPAGGRSGQRTLVVASPAPTLVSLSPAVVPIGADSQVVRLTGTGFTRGSSVTVQRVPAETRYVSPTELDVVLPASELSRFHSLVIHVFNIAPGGGYSGGLLLPVQNPAPVAQTVTPARAAAGRADSLVLTIAGSRFNRFTIVHFGGTPRTTQFVSETELRTVLPPGDVDTPGAFAITVVTPEPGGGSSAAGTLTLTASAPVITALPAYGASAGRPGYALVVHGTGFIRSSVIRWNGQARPTTYISGTRLEMTVTNADMASPGTAQVSVHTPGVGTSDSRRITIRTPGSASVTGLRVLELPAADLVYDGARNRLYASITAGTRSNTVVRINPATGEIDGSVGVGSNPGKLALSSDGSTLWVGLNGSSQVRRVALPAFTAEAAFSLAYGKPDQLHAVPGQPGSVVVVTDGTMTVYDNGAARSGRGHSNSVAFGESAAVMYGYINASSEFGFRTFRLNAQGLTETNVHTNLLDGYSTHIRYAAGRVYGSTGRVVDAGRRVRVGTFAVDPFPSTFAVDAQLGRAFFIHSDQGQLSVFDLNTFQELGSAFVTFMNNPHPVHAIERLVRWGPNGLAGNDGERIYIFRSALAGP